MNFWLSFILYFFGASTIIVTLAVVCSVLINKPIVKEERKKEYENTIKELSTDENSK